MAGIGLSVSGFIPGIRLPFSVDNDSNIRFITPVDGDMLNEYDGAVKDGNLVIRVKVSAPPGSRIKLNGMRTKYADGLFQADVRLKQYENIIKLTEAKKAYKDEIKVFWLKKYVNRYRFSIDDNIWFLKDISENADKYKSIFENPYLGAIKEVHDAYGTKIHLNIYYQTEGFNLSQMTDKFRNEWRENAGWLELSFHALQNEPDRPYINAGYDVVKHDCDLVKDQIRRFAGEEVMGPETTLHWGEGTVEGCRALHDSGYRVLAGYFNIDDDQSPVSYYLTDEQRRHALS